MKTLEQTKEELHEYIDGINDEKGLRIIYEDILKYLKNDSRKEEPNVDNSILKYQQKSLDTTINPTSSDENKSDKELNRSIERWLSDGGRNPG